MKLGPKGRRYGVGVRNSELPALNNQLRDSSLVYGFKKNLYQPVSGTVDASELVDLRAQLVAHGVPLGLEIELEFGDGSIIHETDYQDRDALYQDVVNTANGKVRDYLRNQSSQRDWATFRYAPMMCHKGDGSLGSGGREFVTAPMTIGFAKETGILGTFEEMQSEYIFLGHLGPNTGGHMHMPLGIFSDQQLVLFYKLMEFFGDARIQRESTENPERGARFIQIVGQRKLGSWARWNRLPSVEDYYEQIVEQERGTLDHQRNWIVQKSRHNTIEFRFPKSTYNRERMYMRMGFVNAMYYYSLFIEQASYNDVDAFDDIYNISKFISFVNNSNKFPELARYLRRHWTSTGCVTRHRKEQTQLDDKRAYAGLFLSNLENARMEVRS